MAFLSGVLGAVKDENEVTTYDQYITDPEKRLNKVLEKLQSQIGSGRTGLVDAVGAVKAWLEGYEMQLNGKINNLKNPLKKLHNHITTVDNAIRSLNGIYYDNDAGSKLNVWILGLHQLVDCSTLCVENLAMVDKNLKTQIKPSVEMVSQAVNMFVDNAKRDRKELEEFSWKIADELTMLQNQVIPYAERKGEECIKLLEDEFNRNIREPTKMLKQKLEEALVDLNKWIAEANSVLNAVIKIAENVYNELNPAKTSEPIGTTMHKIRNANQEIGTVNTGLTKAQMSLGNWKISARSIVDEATLLVKAILEAVGDDTGKNSHKIRIAADKLKNDAVALRRAMRDAHEHIEKKVDEAELGIQEIDKAVEADLKSLRDLIKGKVAEYFTGLTSVNYTQLTQGSAADGLDVGGKLKSWIEAALGSGLPSYPHMIATYGLDGLKNTFASTTGFDAMKIDIAGTVETECGDAKIKDHMTQYNGDGGKKKVATPLGDIKRNEQGVPKLKEIRDGEGTDAKPINMLSLRELHSNIINGVDRLITLVRKYAGKAETDKGLQQMLRDLAAAFGRDSVWKGHSEGTVVAGLENIEADLTAELVKLPIHTSAIRVAEENMTKELNNLREKLFGAERHKSGVVHALKDMRKNGVFCDKKWNGTTGLVKIYNDIVYIAGIPGTKNNLKNLSKIIEEADKFYASTINQTVMDCINEITSFLSDQVTDKIKNLKSAALTQFAKRKSAELEELQKLVTQQQTKIQNIIEKDNASGIKCLLSIMSGNHETLSMIHNAHDTKTAAVNTKWFVETLTKYIEEQVRSPSNDVPKSKGTQLANPPTPSSQLVADLQARTYDLLTHLHENNRTFTFDAGFRSLLHDLTTSLSTFNPAAFANPHHPQLLDALKAGMRGLVGEMQKAYVNRYCGSKGVTWTTNKEQKEEPTDDGKRCAKVFMSCLPMLLNDLSKVKERCGRNSEWSKKHLHIEDIVQNGRKPKNPLGTFFRDCGYIVPTSQTSKQDGELQCKHKFDGEAIYGKLVEKTFSDPDQIKHIVDCDSNLQERGGRKKTTGFDIFDILSCLFEHLKEYYRVNHYATFNASKHPSSIYDMLLWLSGLTYNPVYSDLALNGFEALFEEPEETDAQIIDGGIRVDEEKERSLEAYPTPINVDLLFTSLRDVCHHAEETLISLLGHGHSGGIYACEFNTNTAKLTYPSDPSKCLDLLFEVISRVYNQLFFLLKQCSYRTTLGGWYDCWYGQGVGGSAWNCNTLQCPGQRGEQSAKQEHNQNCNQKCDQTAECGLKSPLQSFLEDGLPGFLPHPYSKSNCKPTCSAPGHFGKVCITPMGFNDISGMASRRQQGRHIMDVLREFCGSEHAPLSRLCGLLTCLLTRPPQTLGDMFAFYYGFLNRWENHKNLTLNKHREIAFEAAVREADFENFDARLNVTSMFSSMKHSPTNHPKGDLFSLVACDQPMAKDTYCGRYLQPCGQHIWTVFSEKHAGNYLSWIVYLTETFYDLLKLLYDDCNNKCGQDRSKCNVTSCAVGCPTKSTSESGKSSQNKYHDSKCSTIVTCKSTLPTLCRYGFVFDSPQSLSGEYGDDKKRTCKDFCRALYRVLSDVKEENDVLAKLKFDTIPTFLWNIRSKFFWMTVALWSLSLFYLICVMVGRLDVLHIRSHLRIPSSHKITAQSLLAAAQVGRLAKISYLQP